MKDYSGSVIRYFVISTHYRNPIDFSKQALDDAKNSYERLKNIISEIKNDKKINKDYLDKFKEAMNSDLNTSKALSVLWELIRDEKAIGKYETINKIDKVFGLDLLKKEKINIPNEIRELVNKRERARKNKDWKKADELRNEIAKRGWSVNDTPKGYILKRV